MTFPGVIASLQALEGQGGDAVLFFLHFLLKLAFISSSGKPRQVFNENAINSWCFPNSFSLFTAAEGGKDAPTLLQVDSSYEQTQIAPDFIFSRAVGVPRRSGIEPHAK